jgi:predicted HicB family RNase H-like nuclease
VTSDIPHKSLKSGREGEFMARENFKTFTLRIPEKLLGELRIKAGQLSAERGEYVSLNALIIELLERANSIDLPTKKKRR